MSIDSRRSDRSVRPPSSEEFGVAGGAVNGGRDVALVAGRAAVSHAIKSGAGNRVVTQRTTETCAYPYLSGFPARTI